MTEAFAIVRVRKEQKLARIRDLEEIVPLVALSPLDGPSGSCRGMANLRGTIVPVFDLDGPEARLSPSRSILVYRTAEGLVGLIVDDIDEVVEIPRHQISTRTIATTRVVTLARIGEGLLSVIEPQHALGDSHARV